MQGRCLTSQSPSSALSLSRFLSRALGALSYLYSALDNKDNTWQHRTALWWRLNLSSHTCEALVTESLICVQSPGPSVLSMLGISHPTDRRCNYFLISFCLCLSLSFFHSPSSSHTLSLSLIFLLTSGPHSVVLLLPLH